MSLNVQGYFNALRSYLNTAEYEVTDTDAGRIVLKEKMFVGNSPKPVEYKVRLGVTGEALVINLDKKSRTGNSDSCSTSSTTTRSLGRSAVISSSFIE